VKDSYPVAGGACLVDADIRVCGSTRISALDGSMPQKRVHSVVTRRTIGHNSHGRCGVRRGYTVTARRAVQRIRLAATTDQRAIAVEPDSANRILAAATCVAERSAEHIVRTECRHAISRAFMTSTMMRSGSGFERCRLCRLRRVAEDRTFPADHHRRQTVQTRPDEPKGRARQV
jgi:hypothetical protein